MPLLLCGVGSQGNLKSSEAESISKKLTYILHYPAVLHIIFFPVSISQST